MKKLTALILVAFLVFSMILPVAATDTESSNETDILADLAAYYDFEHCSLDEIMTRFRTEYGLDENNFAMGYYATGTGDSYSFQVDSYREAAATYMLPLNIVFYDLEAAEAIDGKQDAEGEYYVGTYYLPYMYNYTITDDDESMGKTMKDYLGDYREYREVLTQFSVQEYTEEYFTENVFNVRYMMNVLWHIYANSERYSELLDYMGKAYPGYAFDWLLEERYNVAHKYSEEGDVCNDVAIIYTPQPFILAAFTQNVGHAEEMLGALAELLAEYTLYLGERQAQGLPAYISEAGEQPEADPNAPEADPESETVPDTTTVPNTVQNKEDGPVPIWLFILVIVLAIALIIFAYMRGLVNGAKMERNRIQAARKLKKIKEKQAQQAAK